MPSDAVSCIRAEETASSAREPAAFPFDLIEKCMTLIWIKWYSVITVFFSSSDMWLSYEGGGAGGEEAEGRMHLQQVPPKQCRHEGLRVLPQLPPSGPEPQVCQRNLIPDQTHQWTSSLTGLLHSPLVQLWGHFFLLFIGNFNDGCDVFRKGLEYMTF